MSLNKHETAVHGCHSRANRLCTCVQVSQAGQTAEMYCVTIAFRWFIINLIEFDRNLLLKGSLLYVY